MMLLYILALILCAFANCSVVDSPREPSDLLSSSCMNYNQIAKLLIIRDYVSNQYVNPIIYNFAFSREDRLEALCSYLRSDVILRVELMMALKNHYLLKMDDQMIGFIEIAKDDERWMKFLESCKASIESELRKKGSLSTMLHGEDALWNAQEDNEVIIRQVQCRKMVLKGEEPSVQCGKYKIDLDVPFFDAYFLIAKQCFTFYYKRIAIYSFSGKLPMLQELAGYDSFEMKVAQALNPMISHLRLETETIAKKIEDDEDHSRKEFCTQVAFFLHPLKIDCDIDWTLEKLYEFEDKILETLVPRMELFQVKTSA